MPSRSYALMANSATLLNPQRPSKPLLAALIAAAALIAVPSAAAIDADSISLLSVLALPVLGISAALLLNERFRPYWIAFSIVAIPGPVNHFLPRVFIGPADELGASPATVVGYLDLVLLVLTFAAAHRPRAPADSQLRGVQRALTVFALWATASFLANALLRDTSFHLPSGLWGLVQAIRPAWYWYVLSRLVPDDNPRALQSIAIGFVAANLTLLVNATYYTGVVLGGETTRLEAGTLAVNAFGSYLAVTTVLLLGVALDKAFRRPRWIPVLGVIVSLGMLILTQTRMSLLALVAGLVLLVLLHRRGGARVAVAVVAVLGASAAFFLLALRQGWINSARFALPEVWSASAPLLDPASSSVYSRLVVWLYSIQMFFSSPIFGVGPGQFNWAKYDVGSVFTVLLDAHNGYLQMLAEYGLVGISLPILLVFVAARAYRRTRAVQGASGGLSGAAAAAYLSWALAELTNAGINKPQIFLGMLTLLYLALRGGTTAHPAALEARRDP